jgi:hypothetical protein
MKKVFWFLLRIIVFSLFLTACGGGGDSNTFTNPPPTSGNTSATGNVSSNTSGISSISTESGAKITVPEGAVSKTQTGETGTIAFSIEKDSTTTIEVPAGITKIGDAYRFGPSGTIFVKPVAVTLPVPGNYTQDQLKIYRVNQTTGKSEMYSGIYDATAKTITAQTYEFSPWFLGFGTADNKADGCINVDNNSAANWRTVTTGNSGYTLTYPDVSSNFTGAAATWAPPGTIGWASKGNWYLPQGTYQMCVEGDVNGVRKHSTTIPKAINSPWRYDNPVCTDWGIGGILLDQPGPCPSTPTPTTTVGTGVLQINLMWHSNTSVDLDLYVTDPMGNTIYYGNTSANGGNLDRDNQCTNYVNGKPENIFWTSPTSGQYTIKVDFFSACSNNITSMPFEVRVVNNGVTTTYPGTALSSTSRTPQLVTVINVIGSGGTFTNKLTIGSGFNGTDITGIGTSFSLAATSGGTLYARMESGSPYGTKFARLYINDGTYGQKDYCTTCNSQPLLNAANVKIGQFRITDTGSFTLKAYAVTTVVDIGVETLLGQATVNITQ